MKLQKSDERGSVRQKEVQRQRKVQPAIGKWSAANISLTDMYRQGYRVYIWYIRVYRGAKTEQGATSHWKVVGCRYYDSRCRGPISVYLSLEICYNASMHRHLSSDTFQFVVFFSKHLTSGLDAAATGRL